MKKKKLKSFYRFFCKRTSRFRVGSLPAQCRFAWWWWFEEGGLEEFDEVDGDGRSEFDEAGNL